MQKKKTHHFFTEDNVALELTFKKLFTKLWPFLRHHPQHVALTLFLVTTFVALGRGLPFLFAHAIDSGIRQNQQHVIFQVALVYLILEVARAAFSFWQNLEIQTFGNRVLFEVREKLLKHVQSLPLTYFEKNPSGRTVTRVTNDVFALGEIFSQGFAVIFVNLVEMASIFISLAWISLRMTGVITLILPVLLWICFALSHKIRLQFGAAKRKLSMINAFNAEAFSGIKILQIFNRTPDTRTSFEDLSREYRELQLSTVKLFALLWPTIEAFNLFTLVVALFVGAYFHRSHGLSIGSLTAYIILLQSFFKPLRTILERYNQLQNSLASADRVFQLFDEPCEDFHGTELPASRLRGKIEFANFNFRYSEKSPYVLRDIHLRIAPGQSVALVGRTGSGKTTLVSLLQKFYEIHEGDIWIDDLNLREISAKSLRSRLAVVQQDGFVFSGSLFTNISLYDPRISREKAQRAAEQAQCQELLAKHGGLDGRVLERGSNLSAGERQLLAFARVLAFDPDILILDEATANIDSLSERSIQKATEAVTEGRTSLIIAHRLSTILHCDLIVVMDKGRIIESGQHEELIRLRGHYYELYRRQFANGDMSSDSRKLAHLVSHE